MSLILVIKLTWKLDLMVLSWGLHIPPSLSMTLVKIIFLACQCLLIESRDFAPPKRSTFTVTTVFFKMSSPMIHIPHNFQVCSEEQSWNCAILSASILQQRRRRPSPGGGQSCTGPLQPRQGHHRARCHQPGLCTHGASSRPVLHVWSPRQEQVWCWVDRYVYLKVGPFGICRWFWLITLFTNGHLFYRPLVNDPTGGSQCC